MTKKPVHVRKHPRRRPAKPPRVEPLKGARRVRRPLQPGDRFKPAGGRRVFVVVAIEPPEEKVYIEDIAPLLMIPWNEASIIELPWSAFERRYGWSTYRHEFLINLRGILETYRLLTEHAGSNVYEIVIYGSFVDTDNETPKDVDVLILRDPLPDSDQRFEDELVDQAMERGIDLQSTSDPGFFRSQTLWAAQKFDFWPGAVVRLKV